MINNLLCGSWEESAKDHVQEVWKYSSLRPTEEDANFSIREHLDYMIDSYFNKVNLPFPSANLFLPKSVSTASKIMSPELSRNAIVNHTSFVCK